MHAVRDVTRRALALLACTLVLAYPVRALFVNADLPLWLKLAWAVVALVAWWRPEWSLLAFLGGSPLLAVVPMLARWPTVALPSLWLAALLVPAWLLLAWRPSPARLPVAATCLLLLATASLVATVYPLHLARDSVWVLASEIHHYLRDELLTAISQRPVLSPVLAWVTLAEGVAVLWLVLGLVAPDAGVVGPATVRAAMALATGAGVVGVWAIEQRWTREHLLAFWVEQDPYIVRVNASFTDVNALGAYLAALVTLVVAVALLRPQRAWRLAWLGLAAAAALGIVFTASRIAWLAGALALAGFVTALLAWPLGTWPERMSTRLRRTGIAAAISVSFILLSLTAWATWRDVRLGEQRSYLQTLLVTLNLQAPIEERLKGRGELWAAAVRMIAARPVAGVGLGRYFKDVSAWTPHPEKLVRPQENAHNYFLQTGAELGLPGLLCLTWLFGAAIRRGASVARAPGPNPGRRIALALALGVAAFALTSLTGHSLLLHEGQVTFWALAALALGLSPHAPRPGRHVYAWTAWVVPLMLCLLVLTLPARVRVESSRVDLSRLTLGLHDEEWSPAGDPFRWTGGRAVFHVPAAARVVSFRVRSLAPFDQVLQVRYAGQLIQQVRLADHEWHALRFVLPATASREAYRRFELHVDPPWRPPDDPRDLGVMMSGLDWTP
jgi:O-antigen ligase